MIKPEGLIGLEQNAHSFFLFEPPPFSSQNSVFLSMMAFQRAMLMVLLHTAVNDHQSFGV